jgi:hypothetical protein
MENEETRKQDSGLPSRPLICSTARLVEVHCYACDYDGYGDPDDACYFCGEYELQETDRDNPDSIPSWLR